MKIAVIGAGVIGQSWAELFASHGHEVVLSDPREDLGEIVEGLAEGLADVGAAGSNDEVPPGSDGSPGSVRAAEGEDPLADAASGADFVQECGPERVDVKRELFAAAAEHASARAVFASSSSAIPASVTAEDLPDDVAARLLVGHPFNPPHIMPLVEVVPSPKTSDAAVQTAVEFYRGVGREPIVLKKEARGFVGNRLQNAVLREAVHLVQSGVVDVEDLDAAVRNSLGIRWAAVGPFEGLHLGGGKAGLRGLIEHIGPSFAQIDLPEPDMSMEGMTEVFEQTEAAYGLPPAESIAVRRDEIQNAILRARAAGR